MIKLKHFVTEALKDIFEGVQAAQESAESVGAIVSPIDGNYRARVEPVEFDIEVSTAESSEQRGGFGIFVGALGVGARTHSDENSGSVGRIRFKVHVAMPVQEQEREKVGQGYQIARAHA